ncbi:S-adenosyl-L-methionine-dependent methyltransferase [Nemania diffusa]|nr:S-adenosyl-L-methionine-dependent methyltransferase [Nemania diffusa]
MPRLAPSLIRRAARLSPHLAALLPACRTVATARSELRWIREHALASSSGAGAGADEEARVARLVARRGRGEPLQYVLGSQPFAGLDIRCAKGVLIPRAETEAWAGMLGDLVFSSLDYGEGGGGDVRIADLCAGTGCIGLSLYARGMALRRERGGGEKTGRGVVGRDSPPGVRVFGLDIEPRAVRLARRNLLHNFHAPSLLFSERSNHTTSPAVTFQQADIFADEWMTSLDAADTAPRTRRIDVLVSNPPYISHRGFATDTGRSVRNYEPKLALVPPPLPIRASNSTTTGSGTAPEDVFYTRLLDLASTLRPRVAAFEVGDMGQALRVAEMAIARRLGEEEEGRTGVGGEAPGWEIVEIWRDWPDCRPGDDERDGVRVGGRMVPVRGSGHGRVVFLAEGGIMRSRYANRGCRREVYEV